MATVPSEMTAVAGTVLTAAQWNSNVRDAVNFLCGRPVFEGRQTVSQSISNNVATAVLLDTGDIDNDGGHSLITNTSRYTIQTAGRFAVTGKVGYASNGTGNREGNIWANGTMIRSHNQLAVPATSTRVTLPFFTAFFNVGDYVESGAYQSSGGSLSSAVANAYEQSTLTLLWVGVQ